MNVFKVSLVIILLVIAWAVFRPSADPRPAREEPTTPLEEPAASVEESAAPLDEPEVEEEPKEDPLSIEPVQSPPAVRPRVEPTQLGSIQQVHKYAEFYLAGQPTEEDIALLKERGFKTVLNFRRSGEIAWDEKSVVEQQGMEYVHLPFQGVPELTSVIFDQALEVLRDDRRRPILIHCGSSNRVGAIWYAYRVLDDKLSHEDAAAEARTAGLRTEGYLKKARDYLFASELLPEKEAATSESTE